MNMLASTTAASLLDARVEDAGGLYAFALFFPGYAYFYFCFYPSVAGGP